MTHQMTSTPGPDRPGADSPQAGAGSSVPGTPYGALEPARPGCVLWVGVAVGVAGVVAGLLITVSALVGAAPSDRGPVDAASSAGPPSAGPRDELAALRDRVGQAPGAWPAWSALGAAELERGRATGDPAAYAAAQRAFDTSLRLHPADNDEALAGQGALSAARHDFALAERQARAALSVNADSPEALAVLTDALTEQGRYDEALATARRLDRVRPGIASFTRLSYQAELRGNTTEAVQLMRRAAAEAATPAQVAFARSTEGMLLLSGGDRAGARAAWQAGTGVAADDAGLLLLGARLAWADGDRELAVRRFADLVARRATPTHAVAYAEALAAVGRPSEATAALDVARAGQLLARRSGIRPEPVDVLIEADHGDPKQAVALATEIWRRSPTTGAADAYAWALHAAGRDGEALAYADRALALGARPAAVLAHRGTIRAALGDRAGAAADLGAALATDPAFSALNAPLASRLLHRLQGTS